MTEELHMVRIQLDLPLLLRAGGHASAPREPFDLGYLIHSAMAGVFGEAAPKPFAVTGQSGRWATVLGYGSLASDALRVRSLEGERTRLREAVDWSSFATKPMPDRFEAGSALGFEVRVCPVVRKSSQGRVFRKGAEIDLFLAESERMGPQVALDRAELYVRWLRQQLSGVELLGQRLVAYRRCKLARFGADRRVRYLDRPDARFEGELVVREPEAFHQLLTRGIGRHRAFGFGMLLIRSLGGSRC